MNDDYSLAESFSRGLIPVQYPNAATSVSYYIRIYPGMAATNLEEIKQQIEDGVPASEIDAAVEDYGWVASCDYCNEDTHEIIHRFELVRNTKEELFRALAIEYESWISDRRQRKTYLQALKKWKEER